MKKTRSGRYETIIFVKLTHFYVRYLYTLSSFIFLFHIICQNRLKTSQFPYLDLENQLKSRFTRLGLSDPLRGIKRKLNQIYKKL